MVGKIILWVFLGLLALLAAALLIPVKIRGSYEDGTPLLYIRYGPVKFQLFPPKEKAEYEKRKPPKKKKPKAEKPPKPKKPKAKINMDQILYALEKLPPHPGPGAEADGPVYPYPAVEALGAGGRERPGGCGHPLREDGGGAVRRIPHPGAGAAAEGCRCAAVCGFYGTADGLHRRRGRIPAALEPGLDGPSGLREPPQVVSGIPEAGLSASSGVR